MDREIQNIAKSQRSMIPLLLITALLILVISTQWPYISGHITSIKQELAAQIDEIDIYGRKSRHLMAEIQATRLEAEKRLNQIETNLIESQQYQAAKDAFDSTSPPDSHQKILETVEQLITLAAQHLHLTGNVNAALDTMRKAQACIQDIHDENLISFRNILEKDIENLKAATPIETLEINSRLNTLTDTISTLPLAMDHKLITIDLAPEQNDAQENRWLKLMHEILQDIKELIHIQKIHDSETALLSPSQVYFLHENLKLKLILARFSLLSRDETGFKADLKTAKNWIVQYYDKQSADVIKILQVLNQLQDDTIGIKLPNISASLDAIRTYRLMHTEETI